MSSSNQALAALAKRLEHLRKSRNWKQVDVATKLQLHAATYCNYENGNRNPDFDTLMKLANLYDVSIDYLLGATDEKEVQVFRKIEDESLKRWIISLGEQSENDLEKLRAMWTILNNGNKGGN